MKICQNDAIDAIPRGSIFFFTQRTLEHITNEMSLYQIAGTSENSSLDSIAFFRTNQMFSNVCYQILLFIYILIKI